MARDDFEIETIVVGAGVVGLAIAAELARTSEVVVLESAGSFGAGISSRNSEVIHAGMYYAADSLKHRLCVRGRRLLYPYLEQRSIAHRRTEKLIVAADECDGPQISALFERGKANGVEDLDLIGPDDARRLEPALRCHSALWSKQTGILDSHGLMLALTGDLQDRGGSLAFETQFSRAEVAPGGGFRVTTEGREGFQVSCRRLVNSAGLHAHVVARQILGLPLEHIPPVCFAKGSYFASVGRCPFSRLIYPAPVDGGLGIHLTLDLSGQARFGPDVEWLNHSDPERINYDVEPSRGRLFETAVRRFWPGLQPESLTPSYSGCRPKLNPPGGPPADFRISHAREHGIPGLVNLFGIESPGLTSALAIAEFVAAVFRNED